MNEIIHDSFWNFADLYFNGYSQEKEKIRKQKPYSCILFKCKTKCKKNEISCFAMGIQLEYNELCNNSETADPTLIWTQDKLCFCDVSTIQQAKIVCKLVSWGDELNSQIYKWFRLTNSHTRSVTFLPDFLFSY